LKSYNLIRERWIPVKRSNGDIEQIAPFEITSQHDTNPIVAFAWPRPDFDLASHEFLMGLLAAIYPADPREPKQWTRLFHTPPSPAELATAFVFLPMHSCSMAKDRTFSKISMPSMVKSCRSSICSLRLREKTQPS
jgi:hypothetical protein